MNDEKQPQELTEEEAKAIQGGAPPDTSAPGWEGQNDIEKKRMEQPAG